MQCPICEGETRVLETRDHAIGTRRRRECLDCSERFNTFEVYEDEARRVKALSVLLDAS
jgi:transcriptional regulator NrdR family protein